MNSCNGEQCFAKYLIKIFEATTKCERAVLFVLGLNKMTTEEVSNRTNKIYPQTSSYLNHLKHIGIVDSVCESYRKPYFIRDEYKFPVLFIQEYQKNRNH